ncbi:hypothetical protein OG372_29620 [Streptomyces sp. NBC_01020]|nr:hypothetical protein OG372_29620 [Streptomyces sp. NBC_01020]WSX66444.1 hypothetical protein OG221_07360 [Streptomyces sp. NBC_00932]
MEFDDVAHIAVSRAAGITRFATTVLRHQQQDRSVPLSQESQAPSVGVDC